jgi:hypothetical protein
VCDRVARGAETRYMSRQVHTGAGQTNLCINVEMRNKEQRKQAGAQSTHERYAQIKSVSYFIDDFDTAIA